MVEIATPPKLTISLPDGSGIKQEDYVAAKIFKEQNEINKLEKSISGIDKEKAQQSLDDVIKYLNSLKK
jgi:hypothetical protein